MLGKKNWLKSLPGALLIKNNWLKGLLASLVVGVFVIQGFEGKITKKIDGETVYFYGFRETKPETTAQYILLISFILSGELAGIGKAVALKMLSEGGNNAKE